MNYSTAQLRKSLFNSKKGFTLIELLVVIAIIAVLAVMGFAAFTGLTGRGNDDRRSADVKAIADALEVARGVNTTYQPIFATSFASGTFPVEPTGRAMKYCILAGTTPIANPAVWTTGACPATWTDMNAFTSYSPASTVTHFKVCTMKEDNSAVICQASRQ